MNVLEAGSGPGFFTEKLLELLPNSSVTALEIDPVLYVIVILEVLRIVWFIVIYELDKMSVKLQICQSISAFHILPSDF